MDTNSRGSPASLNEPGSKVETPAAAEPKERSFWQRLRELFKVTKRDFETDDGNNYPLF